MKNVEVSVCIITYGHENYIRQALDSVFAQETSFDFEVIVGEDASPDNTREILLEYKEKYGDKLILVLHDENVGVSKNSQSVQRRANGKYIASLEGDDYWTDNKKLQKQYDILESHPEYSACCHDIMCIAHDGKVTEPTLLKMKKDRVKTMKNWLREGYTVHTCSIFRRNFFPLYDEKYIKLRTAEPTMGDLITFTLLYDAGAIYVLKDVMAAHRAPAAVDKASFSFSERNKIIENSYMFIRIVNNVDEYLNHKYRKLKYRSCNRIAYVKYLKIIGAANYDSKEMKKLMETFSLKMKINVYLKLFRKLFLAVLKKLRMYHG